MVCRTQPSLPTLTPARPAAVRRLRPDSSRRRGGSTPIACRRPCSITDQRGHVTDFTYASHGGVLSVTRPAPTPGAVRPQTRFVYASQSAWYKAGGSGVIGQAAPVWVQVETSACATTAACDGSGSEVQITIVHQAGSAAVGQNGLFSRP